MGNEYKLSELCDLLKVSRPTVEKRLEKIDNKPPLHIPLRWTTVIDNNREVKAVVLSKEQEHAIGLNNDVNMQKNEFETPSATPNKPPENKPVLTEEFAYKLMEFQREYKADLNSYSERVINAEKKLNLLEVSESSKDRELARLNALVKELSKKIETIEAQNEALKKELAEKKKPFWKKNVL